MKTPEELNALKTEFEALKGKLADLTEEELSKVTGGADGEVITQMECPCAYHPKWAGDWVGQKFDCIRCGGRGTLEGKYIAEF